MGAKLGVPDVGCGEGGSVRTGCLVGGENVGFGVGEWVVGLAVGGDGTVGAIVCRVGDGDGSAPTVVVGCSSHEEGVGADDTESSS